MKTAKKITVITAVGLIFAGILISLCAFAVMGFDIAKLNTMKFTTRTYTVEESFSDIDIEGAECEIRLLPSENGVCSIRCTEGDKINHTVAVEDGTLRVKRTDNRRWYECIGIYWGRMEVTVFLPEREYGRLYVKTASGDVEIPDGFTFTEADIHNTSGEVSFSAAVKNDLSVKTVSGDLYIGNTNPKGLDIRSTSGEITVDTVKTETDFTAQTVSGDIELKNISCKNAAAESTSGEITFSKLYASEQIRIGSVSGDVDLRDCDAAALRIKTTSGGVSGRLLTEKIFVTDTVSGDVHVPESAAGGKCEVETTSGDIEFSIG